MKNKLLIVFLIIVLIGSAILLSGCGKKMSEITIKDNKTGYTAVFKYPEEQTFKVTDEDQDSGKYVEMTIENEANNIELEVYFFDESKNIYNSSKDNRKDDEGFKEYNWNKHEGYIYNVDDDSLYFNIVLQDETADGGIIGLFGSVSKLDYNKETKILESFDSKDFQDFMNTVEFKTE